MKNFNYAAVSGGHGVPCGLNTIKSLISCPEYNVTRIPFCLRCYHKSVNLQYITLVCLDDGTNESLNERLMFQVSFFYMISCKILCKNPFNLFSHFFYKITKIKIKSFECPKSIKSWKKK